MTSGLTPFALLAAVIAMAAVPLVSGPQPSGTVPAGPLSISDRARALVVEYECGGKGYYQQRLSKPTWPGGASGVTIGIGYDLGYNTREQIARDWTALGPDAVRVLQSVAGIKGQAAKAAVRKCWSVVVPWETALTVFERNTLARFGGQTAGAFPGITGQHPHGQGALLSIVFNRGPGMAGDSRREMRAIRDALAAGQPERVPGHIRAMRRLWVGKGLDGLLRRREAEAVLFAAGLPP